jgi:TM2 domain-containing membrane protein YozV
MKQKSTAIILALLLGGIGMHKFYLGKNVQGIFYILFCWTLIPGIIAFFELIGLCFTSDESFNRTYNSHAVLATAHAVSVSSTESLSKLADLFKQNVITREEFEAKKATLLAKIG